MTPPNNPAAPTEPGTALALLEFQSQAAAVIAQPMPRAARGTVWVVTSLFLACLVALGTIRVDQVVAGQGKVVAQAPPVLVQPLETAIVRAIHVREGQAVRAGELLAELDPTFAAADLGALANQVGSLQAEVARLRAELAGTPFQPVEQSPAALLQAAIHAQRAAEFGFRLENYRQRIAGAQAALERAATDAQGYQERRGIAERVESMRKELERLQVGSRLNSLAATDNRIELERGLQGALRAIASTRGDLAALQAERDGYVQSWRAATSQTLAEQSQKLSDAIEAATKAALRRRLVELRADRDATVLTVARVSVGSVLQSGDAFVTLVPAGAPLEVEANISGRDAGFVREGQPVAVKFDTFPFAQYGLAEGRVRIVSADSFTAQDDARGRAGAVPVNPGSTEPFFRARITLEQMRLHDLPAAFHLAPGMPVTADIKVGQRSVLHYLMGKLMPLALEGMREP